MARPLNKPSSSFLGGTVTPLIVTGLVILVWISFGQSLHNEFVSYDDGDYVYENPVVSRGLTLHGIWWAFSSFHAANWHPLTTISHMIDCQLFGLQPWGHHLTNIVLHTLGAVLLFLALRRLITSPSEHSTFNFQYSTTWASAFVAALFAIHPLRVESVAWISERKDVLSGVFFMLTLLAYVNYARAERQRWASYLLVTVFFALGLMCKPTLVTVPFVLLLLDYWPLGRMRSAQSEGQSLEITGHRLDMTKRVASTSQRLNVSTSLGNLVVEKLPLFALSAASCVITFVAQQHALERAPNVDLVQRIANAGVSYLLYLWQLVYPGHLTVAYPYVPIRPAVAILAIVFLAIVTAIFIRARKRYPFLITGWLWYLGMLVPMIGLIQVGLQPRADRYTYLSQIGLYLIVTCSFATFARKCRSAKPFIGVIAVAVLAVFVAVTRTQAGYWHDSETLWRHAIQATPNNYVAHDNLGTILLRQHRPDAALLELTKAIELKHDLENAYVSAGSASMLLGRLDSAIGYYQGALQLQPDSAENWSNLATAFLKQGKNDEAIGDYKKAAALNPNSGEMQYNLGHALAGTGQWSEAIDRYRAAIRLQPNEAKFHNNLAVALIKIERAADADAELRTALQLDPNYPDAHYNLGCLLASLGRKNEAAVEFGETLRLRPGNSDAEEQLRRITASSSKQ